jgi:hypothetical protein
MNKILLIYAEIIFIGGVVLFTYAQLKKDKEVEEPETNRWMRVIAIMLIILAAFCLILAI